MGQANTILLDDLAFSRSFVTESNEENVGLQTAARTIKIKNQFRLEELPYLSSSPNLTSDIHPKDFLRGTKFLIAQSAGAADTQIVSLLKGKTSHTSVLDITLNNLMVRLQLCQNFRKCGVPLITIALRSILASFFQAAVTSILLYGCTTWTLTKRLEKKLDGNYTRMLRAILNKSWQQHPTRHQLYGHLPPITKSIQVRRTRHAGHCWRSRDELIRDVLLWIPTHGRAKAGRPARTYIQQLCEDTGCCPEDLPRAMNDREEWRERVRDIRAASTI